VKIGLCWIRRDLRLHDHHALSKSLKENDQTFVCFILDRLILDKIKDPENRRISFIAESLGEIEETLKKYNAQLILEYGDPTEVIPQLIDDLKVNSLYFNRDYEPYAKKRDSKVENVLNKKGIDVHTFKDVVHFEKNEVLNLSGNIYKVFTPYKNKWLETFHAQDSYIPNYQCDLKKLAKNFKDNSPTIADWIKKCGFSPVKNIITGGTKAGKKQLKLFETKIEHYKSDRDFPYLHGTSMLSTHVKMGTLSIRDLMRTANQSNDSGSATWFTELIWREFYQMILDAFPEIEIHCFRPEYDQLNWEGREEHFKAWCDGLTGFPIIDAAMRELNLTGFMHNRLRMVVASFLTKTLLIDWKIGERFFAEKLLDYDMAANNGGWQWSASTGVDAQPYFRIFNPYNQSLKFDPLGIYIRQWCPELSGFTDKEVHSPQDTEFPEQDRAQCFIGKDYPAPIVSYKSQKERALAMFKKIKNQN
jgi:deoxyribodipyrimidine photo-lyase